VNRPSFVLLVALAALIDQSARTRPLRADENPPRRDSVTESAPEPATPSTAAPAAPAAATTDRRWYAVGAMAGIYVPLTVWSYFAWYYDQPNLPDFEFGGDGYFGRNTYAGGADKLGHFWGNLALSRGTTEILRWGGFGRLRSAIWASSLSFAFFAFVEVKDGFYYEFSPGDLLGNGLGAATSAAMVLYPRLDELLDFRMQYFPSERFRPKLAAGNVDVAEDYSGQTFLVALHLGALPGVKGEAIADYLRFVDLSLGYDSRGYRPKPEMDEPSHRSQELFVGLSLNVQGLVDATLSGRWRQVGHGVFEFWQPPYTTLPVAGLSRSQDLPPLSTTTATAR